MKTDAELAQEIEGELNAVDRKIARLNDAKSEVLRATAERLAAQSKQRWELLRAKKGRMFLKLVDAATLLKEEQGIAWKGYAAVVTKSRVHIQKIVGGARQSDPKHPDAAPGDFHLERYDEVFWGAFNALLAQVERLLGAAKNDQLLAREAVNLNVAATVIAEIARAHPPLPSRKK